MLYTTWLDVSHEPSTKIGVAVPKPAGPTPRYMIEIATTDSDQRVNVVLDERQLRGLIAAAQHQLDDDAAVELPVLKEQSLAVVS